MKILVANLGSTSFKYRLFDMTDERVLARGGVERIGSDAVALLRRGGAAREESDQLAATRPRRRGPALPQAAVRSDGMPEGPVRVGGHRLQGGPCPGHDGRAARRRQGAGGDGSVRRRRPGPQSALHRARCGCWPSNCRRFRWSPRSRPAFTRRSPRRNELYAVPLEWAEKHGIRRWGFHGASHRYIAERDGAVAAAIPMPRSSPATWAAAVRCAPSRPASR